MILRAPDIHGAVMEFLRARLDVPVMSARPDGGTDSFVRVVASGGGGRADRLLQSVQLSVDSYGVSQGAAYALAARVDALIHSMPAEPGVVASVPWSTTPGEYPDAVTGQARYTATYQFNTILRRM